MASEARRTAGIVGAGSIGRMHIRALKELGVRVAAVSSRREEQARKVAQEDADADAGASDGCHYTTDPEALVRRPELDLVVITSSSGSHARLALAALAAGKHVVVEKPMAMNAADARRVIDEASRRKLTLSVISQRRFEPVHQTVKRAIAGGALGKLLVLEARCPYFRSQEYYDSADWRGTISEDGGALMNQAIHSVDLLLWFGGPARQVVGRTATQTHRMEAEDLALGIITFASGAFGSITASTSIRPGFLPALDLFGERGSVRLEGAAVTHWSVPDVPMPAAEGPASAGVQTPQLASHEHHKAQLADILAALDEGRPPAVTGEDGLRAVELVDGVYESSRTGRAVALRG